MKISVKLRGHRPKDIRARSRKYNKEDIPISIFVLKAYPDVSLKSRRAAYREKCFSNAMRGYQEVCRECQSNCKVLAAPNSSFVCNDFMKKTMSQVKEEA